MVASKCDGRRRNFRRLSMHQRTNRSILGLFALAVASAGVAVAQSPTSTETPDIPAGGMNSTWQAAQSPGSPKNKLFVVTVDQPQRRQVCHVRSFTPDRLVCSRAIGSPRVCVLQQILAVILPGDGDLKLQLVLGLNGGLGAAIWGTVILAATCPACAAATGIAAFLFFGAAGAVLIGDDQPDRLLYLARGQQLSAKLGYIQR
jgi:hypothetical protein